LSRFSIVGLLCAVFGLAPTTAALAQDCPNDDPHVTGTWVTLPYQMPLNPVSATLLRDGKILIVAGSEADAYNHAEGSETYRAAIWDPAGTDQSSIAVQTLDYDVFCSGTAVLPDGRPLVIGGTSDYTYTGDSRASFFDPATGKFSQSQSMAYGRWYGTATVLGDGRMMAISGLDADGGTNATVEIYDPADPGLGWGTPIGEPFTPPLYPREFLLPNGKVFFTGQGFGAPIAKGWIFNPAAKTWAMSVRTTGRRDCGSSVLLPLLPPAYTPRVMNFGGGSPSRRTTEIIDLSAGSPSWTAGPNMSTQRIQMNAVLLPNGKILAEGGSENDETPDGPGKKADLYDSVANTMSPAGTAAYSRLYHSTALLLPNATVMSMGSNPGDRGSYGPTIEIYVPPYLYDAADRLVANRPVITGVSSEVVGYNAPLSVTYTSASPIASAVLVRPGSSTHAFDMEQRLIGLCGPSPQPACTGSGTLALTTPPNGNIAPPGYYMLFLLDGAGVPSVARFLELTPHSGPFPIGVISAPATETTVAAGGTVVFGTETVASKYSWVFPGGTPAQSTVQNPGAVTFSSPGRHVASLSVIDASGRSDPSPETRTITVLPKAPDFELTVTAPAATVFPGESAQLTVSVAPVQGFSGSVSLAVGSESGLPLGVSVGGFDPPAITGSGTSTLTMTTTTEAIPYALSLTVTGTSDAASHAASTTLLINLASPTGVAAAASDGQVALTWLPSVGASGYQVRRSLVSGGPYKPIGCTDATGTTDTGLVNGTRYYYVVSASYTGGPNDGGRSADSAEVSAMPPCSAPAYTGSLGASKSDGSVLWLWTGDGSATFDLVRGDLTVLRGSGGDFTAALAAIPAAEPACLANDTSELSLVDPYPDPGEGQGQFALLRAVAAACPSAASYDDGSPALAGSRDGEIAASALSCP
jgi:hypothetical protein